MSREITSVQEQNYFCTSKVKQIRNVFMAAGKAGIGNLSVFISFFFPFSFHSVLAMRQISALLYLKQMKICFDPVSRAGQIHSKELCHWSAGEGKKKRMLRNATLLKYVIEYKVDFGLCALYREIFPTSFYYQSLA